MKSNTADKKITTLYIRKDITQFCRENRINLSEWVNTEFVEKYLGLSSKVIELQKLCLREEEVRKEIIAIKQRILDAAHSLTEREATFIRDVPSLIERGCLLNALNTRFNVDFKRNYNLEEFKELVTHYQMIK